MVAERVIKAIHNVVKDKEVTIDSTFEDLGVDSLDAIEIVFEVEEEFDIDIPTEAAKSIRNVRDVVEGVEKILAGEEIDVPKDASSDGGAASRESLA